MSFKIAAAAATLALASTVSAHGYVQTLEVGDTFYWNYNTTLQYMSPVPDSIGWSDPEDQSNGYISDYTSPDIICHLDATNAQLSAPITAGSNVSFTWNTWPTSHHGPVITYLAKCDGNCSTVDKTTLKFFKIDEGGLIEDTGDGGSWATDTLIANDYTWSSQIPSTIASGNYVIRHEIIALHSAETSGGAQNYPQCMNLEITSDGTDEPEGTLGESLYTATDPGILINIYTSLSTYDIPGPTLYTGGSSGSATSAAGTSATSVVSTVASSTAVATSAVSSAVSSATVVASSAASSAAVKVATTSAAYSSATVVASSAAVSSAAAAETSVVSDNAVVTATATDVVTAQAYTTVTAGATQVASLASQLPSDALTSTIATTLPTATASGSAAVPTKALPSGTTLEELLQWVEYLLEEVTEEEKSSGSSKARRHARDLLVNRK